MTILHTFTNSDDGVTSFVVTGSNGCFNVTLRDDDSGEFVGIAICGFKTIESAIIKAKSII